MDQAIETDVPFPIEVPTDAANDVAAEESPAVEAASNEYLGRWNRLVSSTNWEKGRIIAQWRDALLAAGAAAGSCTDDAWSRRAGSVTPQHTGRLRRVYQRFYDVRESYQGLYWSHFQAALDWDDAEMWLEGAVQNGWSIAQMQSERARTLGAVVEENVAAAAEWDEDAADVPSRESPQAAASAAGHVADRDGSATSERDAAAVDPEFDVQADGDTAFDGTDTFDDAPAPVRPFENLPELPADLRDAFDAFKLAIIHHRLAKWQEVSAADVVATLDALRQLALAE